MKKFLITVTCAALLLTGCGAEKSEETVSVSSSQTSYESIDNTGTGWGFVKKKGKAPDIPQKDKDRMAKYDCYYMDENAPKTLYLTFDEGYENGYTSQILDVLEATHTPAAFFVTGPYLENQQKLVRRMIDDGHIVGNHTVNHVNLPKQSVETVQKELDDLNKTAQEMYGYTMTYMRPPEGEWSERVLAVARDMGYKTILWSFAYKDWDINMQQGKEHAFKEVTPYFHDGAILLLHAVSSDNAAALQDIINCAKEQGFEFKSLDNIGVGTADGAE